MKFYESFINLSNKYGTIKLDNKYKNNYFKNFLLKEFLFKIDDSDSQEKIEELLNIFSIYLSYLIIKPQRLLLDHDNYYIAIDIRTNTKYICYNNFCILDFDINKNNFKSKEEIEIYIRENEILSEIPYFKVETHNGFHIYLLDKQRYYNDINTYLFIKQFNSDEFYKLYCYIRGFSIRLNKKINNEYILKNIKLVNNKKREINRYLYKLFEIGLKYIDNDNYSNLN